MQYNKKINFVYFLSIIRKPKVKPYEAIQAKRFKLPTVRKQIVEEKSVAKKDKDVVKVDENGNFPYFFNIINTNNLKVPLLPFLVDDDDYEDDNTEVEPEPEPEPDSLASMLNNGADDDYYGYEDIY